LLSSMQLSERPETTHMRPAGKRKPSRERIMRRRQLCQAWAISARRSTQRQPILRCWLAASHLGPAGTLRAQSGHGNPGNGRKWVPNIPVSNSQPVVGPICALVENFEISISWRRRRDSNPGYAFGAYNGLANRRLQPLGHVSACINAYRNLCAAVKLDRRTAN
jgi:hypothetical protein